MYMSGPAFIRRRPARQKAVITQSVLYLIKCGFIPRFNADARTTPVLAAEAHGAKTIVSAQLDLTVALAYNLQAEDF
jgi:hypothetical protein